MCSSDLEESVTLVKNNGILPFLKGTTRSETRDYVTSKFDKVVVMLYSSNAMELGTLEDNDKIDNILWLGTHGTNGL